ncbi:hypothetical protein RvY_13762 [Ramazzottius varieornatus]|uniref:Uncharacterized protein n=1 Tax=Ramazzottius varieornatus TaxID=947166 RepID=A0A1D1VP03_RAMVA|nr:hypothetical protein RvY_13762 [Ramazzottius varieornatus]
MSVPELTPNLATGERASLKRNASVTGGTTHKRLSQTIGGVGNVQLNIMADPRVWRGPTHNIYQKPDRNVQGGLRRKDTVGIL